MADVLQRRHAATRLFPLRQQLLLLTTALLCMCGAARGAATRRFYIAAQDVDWNYAPLGNVGKVNQSIYDSYLKPSVNPPKIGGIYRKAVLRGYTDDTFLVPLPRPVWLGILGPILRAEVGDVMLITFFNNATASKFTLHPHGVVYKKDSEGALYLDGTSGLWKADDGVPPGSNHTYTWRMDAEFGPAEDDPTCMTWAYHSHHYAERDINSGLIGALVICKPDTLDPDGNRIDLAKEYVLFYHIMDENISWYIKENARRAAPNATDEEIDQLLEDPRFQVTNRYFSAINGYMFDNLQGVDACVGDQISWHLFSLGNEVDVHDVRFQGQSMLKRRKRSSFATLFPAKFVTLHSQAKVVGDYPIDCVVLDHLRGGMNARFNIKSCDGRADDLGVLHNLPPHVRTYYVAAEETEWDYAPTGINGFTGVAIETDTESSPWFSRENGRPGGQYRKAVFRGYTDATFTRRAPRPDHLGLLGPTMRGEVGEVIRVVFLNRVAGHSFSISPTGAMIQLNGSSLARLKIPASLPVKGQVAKAVTMHWLIPSYAEPTELDDDCIPDYYSSFVDVSDTYAGLVGMTQLCRKGSLRKDGTRATVDREFYMMLSIMDENLSPYAEHNFENVTEARNTTEFWQSNLMTGLNGRCFANLPGLNMSQGERVGWSSLCVGTDIDVHVLHFDGMTINIGGSQRDTVDLFPGVARSFEMVVDVPQGNWEVSCETNTHHRAGMRAKMLVTGGRTPKEDRLTGRVRTFYIAAVEQDWNYAPEDIHPIFNKSLLDVETSRVFVLRDDVHIGSTYKKALFREYTDDTFTTLKPDESDGHVTPLGVMGPLIRAEVGDKVRVIFFNKATRPYQISAHGVMEKSDIKVGVEPGKTVTYTWPIKQRNGPGPRDFDCVTWAYYSSLDPIKDTNSGLIGPLVVCRKGTLEKNGNRIGFRTEVPLLFSVTNENESWYLKDNIKKFCKTPDAVDPESDDFQESNMMHGINGFIFGNLHNVTLIQGQAATFYVLGFGDQVDIHTVHFHGETFLRRKEGTVHRGDVTEVFPSTFATLEMTPINPGHWLLHCHVNDHMEAGMMTVYNIDEAPPGGYNNTVQAVAYRGAESDAATVGRGTTWWQLLLQLLLPYLLAQLR